MAQSVKKYGVYTFKKVNCKPKQNNTDTTKTKAVEYPTIDFY